MFLFIFADQEIDGATTSDVHAQKTLLRLRFAKSGWECPQILDALDATNELYFDRVSQVHIGTRAGSWTRDRVTLLGDGAFCVSLLAGQGSALAMVATYVLLANFIVLAVTRSTKNGLNLLLSRSRKGHCVLLVPLRRSQSSLCSSAIGL